MERKEVCRLAGLGVIFLGLLGIFFGLLWRYQVVEGAQRRESALQRQAVTLTYPGKRGDILDRNGVPLITSETVWQAKAGALTEEQRESLRLLCEEFDLIRQEQGITLTDTAFLIAAAARGIPLEVEAAEKRSYQTEAAPHLLGRVGAIPAEDWETYQVLGYELDDRVGLTGVEKAFEEVLRGRDTRLRVEYDETGAVLSETLLEDGGAGQDVSLTLDLELQTLVEGVLERGIADLGAEVGCAVVVDVRDGGILASASRPDYTLETFSRDYNMLLEEENAPLFDRVFQGQYPPGSVFKLVTAAAGLEEGVIEPDTLIYDTGICTRYDDYQPQCWLYRQSRGSHGWEDVSEALRDSCNVFFYEVGWRLGIDRLEEWGGRFGLGQKTGVELPESAGVLAGPTNSGTKGSLWYGGSTLAAAIGQSDHLCTPLQLVNLTAALANGGTRYALHLTKSVGGEDYEPEVLGELSLSEENRAAILAGMEQVVTQGSLRQAFSDLPVTAGAKTGSAQVAGQEKANGVLVCFAPFEEPEVALCIVVEEAGGGGALAGMAAEILRGYFAKIPLSRSFRWKGS